ncbi:MULTISPECIES: hypothetical protein [Chryseobacterium]|uniref:hypothetical protein n=1 Tax=Chryseobacterium TaxID=59732 RepID=UPI001297163A|nr:MULTISPECIES: hypothetical protein [Chryseobacterium]MDR6923460.1 hypothetical protein [Chryseobacterium sp. 2987]
MNHKKDIIILLTCCVNPAGMSFTKINDENTRIKQYYNAITYYLNTTDHKILIVENTLFNIDPVFLQNERIEYLTFDGNNFDKALGKGYGEALIIEHALQNSYFLKNEKAYIIKITGRLCVINLNNLIKDLPVENKNYIMAEMTWKKDKAYSHFFISNYNFLKSFVERKENINDSKGMYFEHLLAEQIKDMNKKGFPFLGLKRTVIIEGISGSTGKEYTKNYNIIQLLIFKIKNFYLKNFLK